jgi:hypothetical protein
MAATPSSSPIINTDDLLGRTFLFNQQEDGQQYRARIVKVIDNHSSDLEDDKTRIKFLLSVNDNESEDIITYNQLLNYLSKDQANYFVWKFQRIVSHQGPLAPTHPDYKGSSYNVMVECENGETTKEPDYCNIPDLDHDWSCSVYGELPEILPRDAPDPLGKHVTLTHYVDANLMHDIVTGRSVTGILHIANKTPIDWYSKKQATVETATYGSEFVSAGTCVVLDLKSTLHYLGVPLREKSYMLGDNKSVVDSSMTVNAKLHKRHTMLSFHRV